MEAHTNFKAADAIETQTVEEAIEKVSSARFTQRTLFAEAITVDYIQDAAEFEGTFADERLRFTKQGFLNLCSAVGVPSGFAEKVPDKLLLTNLTEMVEGMKKKKLKVISRGAVVVGVLRPGICWLDPKEVLEGVVTGLTSRNFATDRVVVTNDGIVVNAYEKPTTMFDLRDNRFDVGIALDYGFQRAGLLQSGTFSRMHSCLNVAYATNSKAMKQAKTFVKVKLGDLKASAFARFHERVTLPKDLLEAVKASHAQMEKASMFDDHYVKFYKQLAKVIGHEPALGIFQLEEDEHECIVQGVKARKALMEADPVAEVEAVPVRQLNIFKLFDKVTSLAHAYKGEDRLKLEYLGGSLLV